MKLESLSIGRTLQCRLLLGSVLAGAAVAQSADRSSDEFSTLFPSRVKTFVKAGVDPDDRPGAPFQGDDDGFSGINGCEAYRATDSGQSMAVLAHFEGRPGVLGLFFRNFWSDAAGLPLQTGENNRTRIWIDGVLSKDLPLADCFRSENDQRGQVPPFTGPFTGTRSGGHVTHAQLRWNQSFKLGVWDDSYANAARFHRVAATFATPENELPVPDMADWTRIAHARGQWPHASARVPQTTSWTIPAGGVQALQLAGPATVLEVSCQVGANDDWSGLWARFTFDGQAAPSVCVPLRVLGGMIKPPYRSAVAGLLFHNDGDCQLTSYFPMHFDTGARLEFENRNAGPVNLAVTIATTSAVHPQPWGYFTAIHCAGTTVTGQTFQGPSIAGARGTLRGLMLEDGADNTGRIPDLLLNHLEGDLCIRINGNRGDDHTFDGTETAIGRWGWYFSPVDQPFAQDTSFQTSWALRWLPDNQHLELRRLMGSLFVFDPVHFVNGISIALEHGIQNTSNADYALTAFLYVQPGGARNTLAEIDVGDPVSESANQVQFTQVAMTPRTAGFLRDNFFGTGPVTDTVRQVRDFLQFRILPTTRSRALGFGVRLWRPATSSGVCQADVLVDGNPAGLLHCFTHGTTYPWKEGGECEVELPHALTDGKNNMTVTLRPRPGSDPLMIARIWVYEYTK
jgi:hypothetical protein